jgi:hypothetical protein
VKSEYGELRNRESWIERCRRSPATTPHVHFRAVAPPLPALSCVNKRWSLRTFSLPAYHCKSSSESTTSGVRGENRPEALRKPISALTPHPSSLPASPAHNFSPSAHGNNLTCASWAQKPSRPSLHNPSFVVPPSTPLPPLPCLLSLFKSLGYILPLLPCTNAWWFRWRPLLELGGHRGIPEAGDCEVGRESCLGSRHSSCPFSLISPRCKY